MTAVQNIPLIDVSPLVKGERVTNIYSAIDNACHHVGFMYIEGHGIPWSLIERMRALTQEYFAQSDALKLEDLVSQQNYRGYIPRDFFSANDGSLNADCYEGYKLHLEVEDDDPIREECDLYGPNKWPLHPSEMRTVVLEYWAHCDRVSGVLLAALAHSMRFDEAQFLSNFAMSLTNMTLLHYPPRDDQSGNFGIHPHKDTDALTILAPDDVGGLFVRRRDSQDWIAARSPADALIVNIGDLLEIWSGGYYISTPHKVINESDNDRYSFPYFAVPRYDTVVEPMRECAVGFDRHAVHVGDVSRDVWRTNWPDAKPNNPQFDLGTLSD